jgi:hypothetical protein
MPKPRNPRPHLILPETSSATARYRAVNAFGRNPVVPPRDRLEHAKRLTQDLIDIQGRIPDVFEQQRQAGWESGFGVRIAFTSFAGVPLAIDSFDLKSSGIELLNVRETAGGTVAVVWIPEGRLALFEEKLLAYLELQGLSKARDHRKLIDAVRQIRAAVVEDLWTDDVPIPADDTVAAFEAWISTPVIPSDQKAMRRNALRMTPDERIARFRTFAEAEGIAVSRRPLRFPERAVLQLRGTLGQLKASADLLGQLAELRFAPEPAEFFMELNPSEQREWVDDLLTRAQFPSRDDDVPYVCILDTGCSHGHPLLARSIADDDVHTVDAAWGGGDTEGHGTAQSGLALWGDLTEALAQRGPIRVTHRLESVKLLPDKGVNQEDHFGPLTAEAVSRPEIRAPARRRVFSMAITSDTHVLTGKPTAWSAEVDALTSDWAGSGDAPRLMLVSGGNVQSIRSGTYFGANSRASIEDPANAWNAVTVGALTRKVNITEAGAFEPVASSGGLSPYSSSSDLWDRQSPFKPDIVFEGGNTGDDGMISCPLDSLSLLTTHNRPVDRQFATTWATSAATALASRFAADVMAKYPAMWPETVRALMVHSAEWTPELVAQFPGGNREAIERRLRHCGWGEPDLDAATYSGADSLTLIAQSELQPYGRSAVGSNITARDMRIHKLPWPRAALEGLFAVDVELRISLSYFIEPNPGERGRSDRFRYASHGLRFAVQRPTETLDQFKARINAFDRDGEEEFEAFEGADPRWALGPRKRFRGSLHHDRMTCSASDLVSREHIAVFPVGGWWKTREALGQFDRRARYSLVVSINAPTLPNDIDLYVAVEQAMEVEVPVLVEA